MPADKPTNNNPENLKPLPKPIQLSLPSQRPKQQRRLHEPEYIAEIKSDVPDETKASPKDRNKPQQQRHTGKRYFDSAQKAYGQRRPKTKPPKPPRIQKRRDSSHSGPRLGQGDRLYTPPQPKKPLFSQKARQVLRFWSLGIVVIALVVMSLVFFFRHNAWAVYLDNQFIGYMPINREVETSTIHEDAVRHLSGAMGVNVQVREEATVRTARASRSSLYTPSEMIRQVSQGFTFEIVAIAIYINGTRVAILRNEYDAQYVANEMAKNFVNEYTLNNLTTFYEDWQLKNVIAQTIDDVDNALDVIQYLERPVAVVIEHVIRPGDTQGDLAIEFGTTLARIGYLNNISADAILRVGEVILLESTRPRLTVVTVDRVTVTDVIPMDEEEVENPDLHISIRRPLQEGRNGEMEIIKLITRQNGTQVGEPEIISTRLITEPETRVVEVGTSDTAIIVR